MLSVSYETSGFVAMIRRYSVQVRKGRKESPRFKPASQATLCLVVARGETSRDATRRGLLNRGNDSRLLGFFFRHGHGHHGDAATDGDARADETRQRENGHGHVHSLTARHLDFSFVMCSSFSLFVLFFDRVVPKSSVKTIHSFKNIHPFIHQSVCPYKDELNPPPQDARIFVFDAAPRSIFAPDGAFRDDAPRAKRPETDA